MSESVPRPGAVERDRFVACLRAVRVARAHLADARLRGVRSVESQALRAELLLALEQYAAALGDLGAPVPGRIRSEIELYRRLEGSR